MRKDDKFTIGVLAKETQVSVHTVLYYERRGLLPKVGRSIAGYRLYSNESAQRIRFIKRAQGLGFSLKEIREILALHPGATCASIHRRLLAKVHDLDARIQNLRATRKTLLDLAPLCEDHKRPLTECPTLKKLQLEGTA